MKKWINRAALILLSSSCMSLSAQNTPGHVEYYTGMGAVESSYESIAVSMVGWGLGLFGGIALLAALIKPSKASSGTGHNGGAHAHCCH